MFVNMPLKEIDVQEIYKSDRELKREDVKTLVQWAEKQPHLPQITELQMALFLHSCYYKQEAAKTAVDIFFTVRTLCPEIFQSRTLKDPSFKAMVDFCLVTVLPKRLPNGDTVVYAIMDSDSDHYHLNSAIKLFDAEVMIHLHQNGPVSGIHIIMDMKTISFAHFIKFTTSFPVFTKFLYLLQEGLPVRMKALHLINSVSFAEKLLAMLKPFMKKGLVDSLIAHPEIDSLFKYFPKDILPAEIVGGSGESLESLREKSKALISENEDFLESQEKQVVDESKRSGVPKNLSDIFGVEGSFKKLVVD